MVQLLLLQSETLELHYYLKNGSHAIDAFLRNKCEGHVLAIAKEILVFLNEEDSEILNEVPTQGGYKEFFRYIKKHKGELAAISGFSSPFITLLAVLLSRAPVLHPEQIKNLQYDDTLKQLNIQKLRKELAESGETQNLSAEGTIMKSVEYLDTNFKVLKHRSDFYQILHSYPKVEKISTTGYLNGNAVITETIVEKSDFHNFILSTNHLKPKQIEDAIIEIISPVITKDGKYKWRGIFEGKVISFNMTDRDYKHKVMSGGLSFHEEFFIQCVLSIGQEIDDTGIVQSIGYTVSTVLGEVKDTKLIETEKGKKYKIARKELDQQKTLWTDSEEADKIGL